MHYSAMLGHSNQRLLSACIYCVNNDRTLKFSTEAVCLSFPLHPVPSCKCSVYPAINRGRCLTRDVRTGNITSAKSDPFSRSLFVFSIRSLPVISPPCHSSCVFVLTDPFICVHCSSAVAFLLIPLCVDLCHVP